MGTRGFDRGCHREIAGRGPSPSLIKKEKSNWQQTASTGRLIRPRLPFSIPEESD